MNDRDAFLAAIIEAPDDDTPRLVFADWLDDHGEADRAEFVRVQCRLEGCSKEDPAFDCTCPCPQTTNSPCPRCTLRRCERELLSDTNSGRWAGSPLHMGRPHQTYPIFWPWEFRRGFIDSITCSWADCRIYLDAIRLVQPVRQVRLTTRPFLTDWRRGRKHPPWGVARLEGRKRVYNMYRLLKDRFTQRQSMSTVPSDEVMLVILAAEWPGIDFELSSPVVMPSWTLPQ